MQTHLSPYGYSVPKDGNDELVSELRRALTVKPTANAQALGPPPRAFPVYRENSARLFLPRYFGLERLGPAARESLPAGEASGRLGFSGSIRPEQEPAIRAFMDSVTDGRGGGIICLRTGQGKTVASLYIASLLGTRTLVVCHKGFLMDQWRERIAQFLPEARVGLIKQNKVDTEDKDVVIGSLQSLALREYDASVMASFGLVIYDECFAYDQLVLTSRGAVRIGDLYRLWSSGWDVPEALAYDRRTGTFSFRRITYAWEKEAAAALEVGLKGAEGAELTVTCTPNHKFLTREGWREARDLAVGTAAVSYCGAFVVSGVRALAPSGRPMRVYDIEVHEDHTFVLCDEAASRGIVVSNCHHLGAEVFSRAMARTPARVTMGLSATLERSDGLTKVIEWFLGKPVYVAEKRVDRGLEVHLYEYEPSEAETRGSLYGREISMWGGKVNAARMVNNLCEFAPRNAFIVRTLAALMRSQPGRKAIVLSERRGHLLALEALLLEAGVGSVGWYVGGMKQSDLKESEGCDVLLATTVMAAEALDVPTLNTLVMATPMSSIEQAVGRIQRLRPEDRAHVPVVIDVWDRYSVFKAKGFRRLAFYRKHEYRVLSNGSAAEGPPEPEPEPASVAYDFLDSSEEE